METAEGHWLYTGCGCTRRQRERVVRGPHRREPICARRACSVVYVWRAVRQEQPLRSAPLPATVPRGASLRRKSKQDVPPGLGGAGETPGARPASTYWVAPDRRVGQPQCGSGVLERLESDSS